MAKFALALETACVDTIESGKMTKDLVACIHGLANVKEGSYLNTEDFLQAIAEQLERSYKKWEVANIAQHTHTHSNYKINGEYTIK